MRKGNAWGRLERLEERAPGPAGASVARQVLKAKLGRVAAARRENRPEEAKGEAGETRAALDRWREKHRGEVGS